MTQRRQQAFTMVELTVVILIISILAMISVTVYTAYASARGWHWLARRFANWL